LAAAAAAVTGTPYFLLYYGSSLTGCLYIMPSPISPLFQLNYLRRV
jgi:hypothetical protein